MFYTVYGGYIYSLTLTILVESVNIYNRLTAGGSGVCIINMLCVNGQADIAKLLFAGKHYDVNGMFVYFNLTA